MRLWSGRGRPGASAAPVCALNEKISGGTPRVAPPRAPRAAAPPGPAPVARGEGACVPRTGTSTRGVPRCALGCPAPTPLPDPPLTGAEALCRAAWRGAREREAGHVHGSGPGPVSPPAPTPSHPHGTWPQQRSRRCVVGRAPSVALRTSPQRAADPRGGGAGAPVLPAPPQAVSGAGTAARGPAPTPQTMIRPGAGPRRARPRPVPRRRRRPAASASASAPRRTAPAAARIGRGSEPTEHVLIPLCRSRARRFPEFDTGKPRVTVSVSGMTRCGHAPAPGAGQPRCGWAGSVGPPHGARCARLARGRNVTEGHLREMFAYFGDVSGADVMKDPLSGLSKGLGYVDFASPEEAKAAAAHMDQARFARSAARSLPAYAAPTRAPGQADIDGTTVRVELSVIGPKARERQRRRDEQIAAKVKEREDLRAPRERDYRRDGSPGGARGRGAARRCVGLWPGSAQSPGATPRTYLRSRPRPPPSAPSRLAQAVSRAR